MVPDKTVVCGEGQSWVKPGTAFGMYFHWPYCQRKCPYCDFNSYSVDSIPHDEMLHGYLDEWHRRKDRVSSGRLVSVYFGGGTPSLMRPMDIAAVLDAISKEHPLDQAEITAEVNPNSAPLDYLKEIKKAGVNRLSIGVQSFQNDILAFLGRLHDAQQARRTIEFAREAGFESIGMDLIIGSAPSGPEHLQRDLDLTAQLKVEHISAYLLTIEPDTHFGWLAQKGEPIQCSEKEARRQYLEVRRFLISSGFDHYEISNYSLPGRQAVHNSLYWSGETYLGLGPGACSYRAPMEGLPGYRCENLRDPNEYLARCDTLTMEETLSEVDVARETLMTGLRRMKGLSEAEFTQRTGWDLLGAFNTPIENMIQSGLLFWDTGVQARRLKLTEEGILFADQVILTFF